MRKLIYISLIALAGCTTSLSPEPQPVVTGTGISSYFWPDSNAVYTYTSTTGGDNHTVFVSAGGGMLDNDITSDSNTSLHITRANGTDALTGFSHSDLFGFDSSIQVVADTSLTPIQWSEAIRSIATATLFGQTKLYAASDSVLYDLDPVTSMLDRLGPFPKSFTLAEDEQDQMLFAYQMGGDSILWNSGFSWVGDTAPASITAFASATLNFYHDLCWFACGTDLYRITIGSFPQKIASLPSKIVTLAGENNGVAAGLDNGAIYDVPRTGQPQLRQTVPGLVGISFIPGGSNPILAGTSSGVFAIPNSGPAKQIDDAAVSIIFSTGNSIFASVNADSIFHYNANGTLYGTYANPSGGGIITQFARPASGQPNSSQGIYVLSGTSIFRRDSLTTGTWTAINQTISSTPALQPGSLTLLDSNSTWVAGYVERNMGAGLQRGYAYDAISSGPFTSYKAANGATYDSVLVVTYTSKANGVTDMADVPQYTIYYEKGKGPAVIVRTEAGKPTITTSLKQ
jgi:hypothetical protein